MKRLIAISLTAAMLFALTACKDEPLPTTVETQTLATTEVVTSETVVETTQETAYFAPPAWEGKWQALDTEEHFEISQVTDNGFKVVFFHFEEGQIEQFTYDVEYDNAEKTIASEIGSASNHGGWEYAFELNGDSIVVRSKHPDQTYKRSAEETLETEV